MRVGIIGTGAIVNKHVQAYRNIGFEVTACAGLHASRGEAFAAAHGCRVLGNWQDLCRDPDVDFVDVCTFPGFRLPIVEQCAAQAKHVQVEKPIAAELETARKMVAVARTAGIVLGVISQHRFDDSSRFLKSAIEAGRLGTILQADAYVKWFRSREYYSRTAKGTWAAEGGGALINQGIHSLDLLVWLCGPVRRVSAEWQLGALHDIEVEDAVSAVMRYESGALGAIQAATAFYPGYPERVEIHGTKGSAIITGEKLTAWDVRDDYGEPAPVERGGASGAADPMSVSLVSFERQFLDFGEAARRRCPPLVSGDDGYRALELVSAIYRSCREGRSVTVGP